MKLIIVAVTMALAVSFANNAEAFAFQRNNRTDVEPNVGQVNFGTAFLKFIEAYYHMMPCGYSEWYLPPMAPYKMDKYSFNYNDNNAKIEGELSNVLISGMDKLQIIEYSFDPTSQRLTYDVIHPEVQILGEYNVNAKAMLAGLPISFVGDGVLNIKTIDSRVVGEFQFEKVNEGKGLKISSVHISTYVGDVVVDNWNNLWSNEINNFHNRYAREFALLIMQQNRNYMNEYYNKYALGSINEVLADISMDDIINALTTWTRQLEAVKC